MSEPPRSGTPPPEVPEEFAAAYRAAYEQALAAQSVPEKAGGHAERRRHRERPPTDERDEISPDIDLPERTRAIEIGTHRQPEVYDESAPTRFERVRDSGWFVPLLLVLLALLLILGAYVVGRSFADRVAHRSGTAHEPRVVMSDGSASSAKQPVSQQKAGKGAWTGNVRAISGVTASTKCVSPDGQDASGADVSYVPGNLTDGRADTTWRCDGSAVGQKITFDLGRDVPVAEVGLIPGYAKTDETDGTDRYAENNRITHVRWTIGDHTVEQTLGSSPKDRSIRLIRVPRTTTDTVVLQILALDKGARDTTAISEVQLDAAS